MSDQVKQMIDIPCPECKNSIFSVPHEPKQFHCLPCPECTEQMLIGIGKDGSITAMTKKRRDKLARDFQQEIVDDIGEDDIAWPGHKYTATVHRSEIECSGFKAVLTLFGPGTEQKSQSIDLIGYAPKSSS